MAKEGGGSPSSSITSAFAAQWRMLLAGSGAGMITKTSVAPLERVKILFQIQDMHLSKGAAPKYTSIGQCVRVMYQEEGMLSLWKGNGANCTRVVPVYALKFTFNDTYKNMVRQPGQALSDLSFRQMILAGMAAGLCQAIITYPLEVVRTRLTITSMMGGTYRGMTHCAAATIQQEGLGAMYKGITPTLLTATPYVGLQMSLFDLIKRNLPRRDDGSTPIHYSLVAGACAGMVAQTAMYPGDVVRRQMQTNGIGGSERMYKNTTDCVMQILRRSGVRGLYLGLPANMVKCLPEAAIQFTAYDTLKSVLSNE